ncbi:glycosyltransferase [Pseudoalteromonas shioyasakiensis]|nr:glycosyltransferase [Pseudoalteromonas shioyasakiensis]
MIEPLVSIIMPAYNSEKYISESIESVLKQTYHNWELLITDDRSQDSTRTIVESYLKKDARIKLFINTENSGAGAARNNSIKQANGRFIAFLDSDDLWLPKKLELQIKFMLNNNFAFTYTAYQKFNIKNRLGIVNPPLSTNYKKLLRSNVIGCLTAIYDVNILGKRYMPLIRKRQDMGLWLEILKDTDTAYCLSNVLSLYRVDSGMTQNKFKVLLWQWRFYREVVELSYLTSVKYFFMYILYGFKKYNS